MKSEILYFREGFTFAFRDYDKIVVEFRKRISIRLVFVSRLWGIIERILIKEITYLLYNFLNE